MFKYFKKIKISMKYYTFFSIPIVIALFIQILPFTHSGGFYAPSGGYVNHINVSNTIVPNSNTSNNTMSTANTIEIQNAKVFLSDSLGSSYYNKYINYSSSMVINKTAYLYFSYKVPYKNGSVTDVVYGGSVPLERILDIVVEISIKNNSILDYQLPVKPYFINITESEAINKTVRYGFSNSTASIEGIYSINNANNTKELIIKNNSYPSKYYIVWAVKDSIPLYSNATTTKNYYSKLYKGLYLDANNGSILGEFIYNPSILTTVVANTVGYSGSFNLFALKNTSQTYNNNTQTTYNNSTVKIQFAPNFKIIIIVMFIAILIVIMAYIIFRYLMHGL